jgi:polyvinyl alcohol dehydrogenase (cytochrome)
MRSLFRNLQRHILSFGTLGILAFGLPGFQDCNGDPDPGTVVSPSWGGDLENTHHPRSNVTVANVATLRQKWVVRTGGSVSAIPSLTTTRVYVPDWGIPLVGGTSLYAIDRASGEIVSKKGILEYTGNLLHNVGRSSPAIFGDLIIFGDLRNQPSTLLDIPGGHGAYLYAVNRVTGKLVWKTQLESHPLAVTTQSPVVYDGKVFIGTSSLEEAASRLGYDCCSFRGSMLALDVTTGRILWKTYMAPPPPPGHPFAKPDFTGNAVWGSAPSIDTARRQVTIATGNNYSFPQALRDCLAAHRGDPAAQQSECYARLDRPDNYTESVLALDLDTGRVKWARKLHNYGAWTFACDPDLLPWVPVYEPNCQDLDSLDFDFGQAPMLVKKELSGLPYDMLGVGQKSGVFFTFDPDDGSDIWATRIGPGGELGGIEFGSATDGQRFYVQNTNYSHTPMLLTVGAHAGETAVGGIWAALDAATGEVVWQTPDPSSVLPLTGSITHPTWGSNLGPGFFGVDMGPMTVTNGVVFAGSMDQEGHMYAFDAATGAILWSFASGGSVMSAPVVDGNTLYWGSGYSQGSNNSALYAFELP